MRRLVFTIGCWLAASGIAGPLMGESPETIPPMQNCLVIPKEEANVPAQDAGVLTTLEVNVGMQVGEGYLLARIDDMEPQIKKQLAEAEWQAAKKEAENDVNVRYARRAFDVAVATYNEKLAANRKTPNTVTAETLRRVKLEAYRSELAIEQEDFNRELAALTAKARETDVKAAEAMIERRQIRAPIHGQVVEILKHQGEWVAPGDTIMRIVRFDTLWVEGFLNADKYDPRDVDGRPVTVDVELAGGRTEQFTGRVVYASQLIQTGGEYQVRAEVVNREEDGLWILRPGEFATMTVHVEPQPEEEPPASEATSGDTPDTAQQAEPPAPAAEPRPVAQERKDPFRRLRAP